VPRQLFGFIWRVSGIHQVWLTLLSVVLFLFGVTSLEIQRRIVNDAFRGGIFRPIVLLVLAYLVIVVTEGFLKLGLNIYRNWIGEGAVRWLRFAVFAAADPGSAPNYSQTAEGIQLSIVLDEADPIGGFVGECISEPVLQAGVLVSVTGYLLYLQPLMALVVFCVFFPQIGFVPLMQAAINRRVQARIAILREMSASIVGAGGAIDVGGLQHPRIQKVFGLNMGIYKLKFSMNFLMNLMTQIGTASILALGGYFVVTGRTEIGTVVAFLSGLSKINDPWGDLVTWYRDLQATRVKYALVRDSADIGAIRRDGESRTDMEANALGP
jgi:ABC-type multidrug transport system fused ATPase/permease subunit